MHPYSYLRLYLFDIFYRLRSSGATPVTFDCKQVIEVATTHHYSLTHIQVVDEDIDNSCLVANPSKHP